MRVLNHPILKRIIVILIVVLLFVFIGYQIWRANHSTVVTETSTYASISDLIQAEGIIIRDESLITQNTPGVITYNVSDGTKIAKDSVIATVYDTAEEAITHQKRTQLEAQLAMLNELNDAKTTSAYINPDNLDKQIYIKMYSMIDAIGNRDREQIDSSKDQFLQSVNARQIATDQVADFNEKIQSVQAQITGLGAEKGTKKGEVISPASGYFVSAIDGYETTYPYEKAIELTADDLKTKKSQSSVDQTNVIGKICDSYNWYVACVVSPEVAARLKPDAQVSVKMPFASVADVPATIVAVNQTDQEADAAVILQCNYMSNVLSKVRNETIQIEIQTYTGIRVSQQSVQFQTITKEVVDENNETTVVTKDVRGVYIVYGNSIKFVEIVPLYSDSHYVICDPNPEISMLMTDNTLKLYDEVVVGGKDLYDGKLVK